MPDPASIMVLHESARETLRKKVEEAMIAAIPKEALDKVIATEWTEFTTPRAQHGDGYNTPPRSRLTRLIHEEMEKLLKGRVAEIGAKWAANGLDEAMEKVITSASKEAAKSFFDIIGNDIVARTISAIGGIACDSCGAVCKKNTQCRCGNFVSAR